MNAKPLLICILALACFQSRGSAQEIHLADDFVRVEIKNRNSEDHYHVSLKVGAFGAGLSESGFIRADVRAGRETLTSFNCRLSGSDDFVRGECGDHRAELTRVGEMEIALTYVDPIGGSETSLRTLRFEVAQFYRASGDGYAINYQVIGDDLLLSSVLSTETHLLRIRFWIATRERGTPSDTILRCSHNGQVIPRNLMSNIGADGTGLSGTQLLRGAEPVRYAWRRMVITTSLRYREGNTEPGSNRAHVNVVPGAYSCEFVVGGNAVRRFEFSVTPEGHIARHAEVASGGLNLRPGVSFVRTTLLSTEYDFSIQPRVARRTGFFGRPWSSNATDLFQGLPRRAIGQSRPDDPRARRRRHR